MELARRSGVSASYVSLIEHGEKIPSEEVAVRLARALEDDEDLYRVWSVLARMDERTREAFYRLRLADGDFAERSAGQLAAAAASSPARAPLSTRPPAIDPAPQDASSNTASDSAFDDSLNHTVAIPVLLPGAAPTPYEVAPEEIESFLAFDARTLCRNRADTLIGVRVDERSGRHVRSWLRPDDLVLVDRKPGGLDASLLHAFTLPEEGITFSKASLTEDALFLLADPLENAPPQVFPLREGGGLESLFFGTVAWSARVWSTEER
jgi:transcriptional regulator with XRE-family HTH domain